VDSASDPADGHGNGNVILHAYSILLFSTSPEGLGDPAASKTTLLFHWARPQSPYGNLYGFWQTSLLEAIHGGVVNAGHEVMVLVRGVSEQELQDVQSSMLEGTRIRES